MPNKMETRCYLCRDTYVGDWIVLCSTHGAAAEALAILRDLVGCYQHPARVEKNMERARTLLAVLSEAKAT